MARKHKETMSVEKAELKARYGGEIVRGVPATTVERILKTTYTPVDEAVSTIRDLRGGTLTTPLISIINLNLEDRLRYDAELDPSWKQVIPYVVLMHENLVFCTQRLGKSGEQRLVGAASIGVGGHLSTGERVADGMRRELLEEVGVETKDIIGFEIRGYILEQTEGVGSVHMGVVVLMKLRTADIQCLETEKLSGQWIDFNHLRQLYDEDRLESWSRIVAENVLGV